MELKNVNVAAIRIAYSAMFPHRGAADRDIGAMIGDMQQHNPEGFLEYINYACAVSTNMIQGNCYYAVLSNTVRAVMLERELLRSARKTGTTLHPTLGV